MAFNAMKLDDVVNRFIIDEDNQSGDASQLAAIIDKSVTDIVIPDGVTVIANGVFANCPNLKSVTIPDSVEDVRDSAFVNSGNSNGGVKFSVVGNGVKTVGDNAFAGMSYLNKLVLPSVDAIYQSAFGGCTGLEYIYIGTNCTYIVNGAFGGAPITCKVECGFAEGAVAGFPANAGFAGNPASLDITYNVAEPSV